MALPNILIDAGVLVRKLIPNRFTKVSGPTLYDVVLRIDSLESLSTTGWEIMLGPRANDAQPQIPNKNDISGVVVTIIGSYNRGKTFLLNTLFNIELSSGNLVHTEGLSITAGRNDADHIVFIDTAGSDTAIIEDKLDCRKATEALLKETALNLCTFAIIVVNRLRASDQSYIRQVLTHPEVSKPSKRVYIVHNLMDVEAVEDAEKVIDTEVKSIFKAELKKFKVGMGPNATDVNYYHSTNRGKDIRHFIFAKSNTPAAAVWNQQSIIGIMNSLTVATELRRNLDIVNEAMQFINTKLPQLFATTHNQDNSVRDNSEQQLQVVKHATKPFIVLSDRKELENLDENPHELELSPTLLYDARYFLGINSMDSGKWQPNYNLYETDEEIIAIVELSGFQRSDAHVCIIEEAIVIEGWRTDLKQSIPNAITDCSNIPFDHFKLQIPLKCKIDCAKTKMECDNGFYKIACPKKKYTTVLLE
ncbi:unnamed protein product [Adineta steineri]|uniref:SHSP domain-containing protein n=1 Tax=Adineta steineri TaxID=433720 RepID=A0A815KEG0_9BILA|nr:unnamed protein product [Adineta steineri]CAF4073488.1 unnamed protein product [Adineta steineri]